MAWAALLVASWQVDPRLVHAQSPPEAVTELACDGANVHVRAADLEDARAACEAALGALAFLARHGLAIDLLVELDVQPRLPPGLHPSAVGSYNRRSHRVTVLSFAALAARGTWFGVPIDRELHRSVVVHEVAHAVLGGQPGAAALAPLAHEYMAYVAMFGTMDPPLRERVLAHHPGTGFDNDAQINSQMYALDPTHFGVSAWKHFQRLADGRAYFQRILGGEVLRDESMRGN